jgi:hypothetical protein
MRIDRDAPGAPARPSATQQMCINDTIMPSACRLSGDAVTCVLASDVDVERRWSFWNAGTEALGTLMRVL